MPKFRKKPVIVEAEQYFHGKPCKGVKVTNPEIVYSLSGKHFYISHTDARDWLSIEKNSEGKYEALPFAMYEVKSGNREPVTPDNPLVKLYLECFQLKYPEPYAWVETIHKGQTVAIKEGDWVLPEPDGIHFYPCKPDIFENTYEPVEQATISELATFSANNNQ